MQLTLHHRHACCSHHATAAIHHHYLAGFLTIGVLLASLFGIIRSVDAIVWGQAYRPHVVTTGVQGGPDAQTAARYQTDANGTHFTPVSQRILDDSGTRAPAGQAVP